MECIGYTTYLEHGIDLAYTISRAIKIISSCAQSYIVDFVELSCWKTFFLYVFIRYPSIKDHKRLENYAEIALFLFNVIEIRTILSISINCLLGRILSSSLFRSEVFHFLSALRITFFILIFIRWTTKFEIFYRTFKRRNEKQKPTEWKRKAHEEDGKYFYSITNTRNVFSFIN